MDTEKLQKICMERSAQGCDIVTVLEFWPGGLNSYTEKVTLSTEEDSK